MASEEQKKLAQYIKQVHQTLRVNARKVGAVQAWKDHCEQKEVLKLYSEAMHELATKHWEGNSEKLGNSRIQWIVEQCLKYFIKGGKEVEKRKEVKRLQNSKDKIIPCQKFDESSVFSLDSCFTLLDVGSCYNPFKKYPFFTVLPIDLNPACSDVLEADFLNLAVSSNNMTTENIAKELPIQCIPKDHFDIVVFSLLLEYLPSCQQRYICCQKAYSVLKPEGLLFIISPDSKHTSANASLMRKWRICMAHIGFTRIVYEKLPHIHCMAFRKCMDISFPQQWALRAHTQDTKSLDLQTSSVYLCEMLKIPQDDTEYLSPIEEKLLPRSDKDNLFLVDMFEELPYNDS